MREMTEPWLRYMSEQIAATAAEWLVTRCSFNCSTSGSGRSDYIAGMSALEAAEEEKRLK